jgi:exosortase
MPYHEEFMLLLSFPLRLTATVLSAGILNLSGIDIIYAGTSISLSGVNIAITDACSGIKQLDAFILIAFIVVQILHRKTLWKILHFSFIVPAIILGNSFRIVLTVWLFRLCGETVFQNTWHTVLGYGQIIFALLIYLALGKIFSLTDKKDNEEESCSK